MQFFVQNISDDDNRDGKLMVSQPKDTKDSVRLDTSRFDKQTIYAHVGDEEVPILVMTTPNREAVAKAMYLLQSILRLDIWFDHWAAKRLSELDTHNQLEVLETIIDDALVIRARKEHTVELTKHYGRRG